MTSSNRWVQLVAGIAGMVAVANFQYSWTLFVLPLQDRHGWSEVDIQYALYLFFVPAQTWLVPLEGYLAERFGLRKLLISGGVLAGLGWSINRLLRVDTEKLTGASEARRRVDFMPCIKDGEDRKSTRLNSSH